MVPYLVKVKREMIENEGDGIFAKKEKMEKKITKLPSTFPFYFI